MAFLTDRWRPAAAQQPTSGFARTLRGIEVPTLRAGLLGGAGAAGFGLAVVGVPMFLLWIVTPYLDDGPGGVVHLAACVWLLAHGAALVRPAGYAAVAGGAGAEVPLAVSPLLVSALVLVPLYRAGVRAVAPGRDAEADTGAQEDGDGEVTDGPQNEGEDADGGFAGALHPWSALLGLAVGYLLVAGAAVAGAATGSVSAAPAAAFGWVALVALPVAALGVRRGAGPGTWSVPPRPPDGSRARTRTGLPDGTSSRTGLSDGTFAGARLSGWLRLPSWLRTFGWLRLPAWVRRPARVRLRAWFRAHARLPLAAWFGGSERGRGPAWAWFAARARVPGGAGVALRAASAAGAALLAAGGLVLTVSLVLHFGAAGSTAAQIAPDLAGRFALLLLCAVLLPNAVAWAACYALGPGFALGGHLGPLGSAALASPPALPLLSALPAPGRSLLGLSAMLLPAVAGVLVAAVVGRAACEAREPDPDADADTSANADPDFDADFDLDPAMDPDAASRRAAADGRRWGPLATAGVALVAALGTGLAVALCAAASGGALGTALLARVGPSPLWSGLAAAGWSALGVPGAVLVRLLVSRCTAQASPEASGSRWWRRRRWPSG